MRKRVAIAFLLTTLLIGNLACNQTDSSTSKGDESSTSKKETSSAPASGEAQSTEKAKVQKELAAIAREYLIAYAAGNRERVAMLLADDFSAQAAGKTYKKSDWVPNADPNTSTSEVLNPELVGHEANTATLHFDAKFSHKDGTAPVIYRNSMTFVKNSGSWLIKSIILSQ